MPHTARIVATAMRDPCAVIRDLGGDPAEILRVAGLDPSVPAGEDGTGTLPLAAYVALSQAAAERFAAPHFGRLVGGRFDIGNIGAVGTAAMRAPTLGAALRLFEAAFAAVQGESELRLDVAGDRATLSYRILDPDIWPRDQDAELTLGVFVALVARIAGAGWRPLGLAFEHGPNGADRERAAEPRCPVRYGAPANALTFPARLLDQPMSAADAASFRPMAAFLTREAQRREREGALARRVRRAVLAGLGRAPVGQTEIASALGLSRRTLRRRLEEEGAGFAVIVAECRDALARRMLAHGALGAPEIAERLGYSDVTAFERAFRARSGVTPAAFRRALRQTPGGQTES